MSQIKYIFIFILLGTGLRAQTQLDEYLQIAAEQNPGLKAKYSLYLAALEQVDQQGTLPDPTLSFGYFISPVETRVGPQRFKFSLSQMFPWMGTLKVREKAASAFAKIKFDEFQEAKNKLFLNVEMKWLELYELDQEIQITKANLDILRTYEPITKTKYEANLVSLADLIRVQIKIDEAKTQLNLLELKRSPLLSDFNTMLNRELDVDVKPNTINVDEQASLSLDSALVNQPSVLVAKSSLETATHQITLAELKRKPNLGFGLDYAFVGKRNDVTIADNGKDILMPMISLSLPIFGKKNSALKKEAKLRKEGLEFNLEMVEDDLKNQWNKAQYKMDRSNTELSLYTKEIQSTNILLRVLTTEYSNNHRNFEELLITQQRLLQLQLAEVRAKVKSQEAYFQKEYLTGKNTY